MIDKILHEIVYKKRLVAFLDVMGFKSLLGGGEGDFDRLREFYGEALTILKFLKSDIRRAKVTSELNFQSIFVSDSIVVSIEVPEDKGAAIQAAHDFFRRIGWLQAVLAFNSQIWIRGAISIGDLYVDEDKNILVGPAFVRAYNLEATADFPRVIVDPIVCRNFELMPHQFVTEINSVGTSVLMGPSNGMRWGGAIWMNDAIQVDWFFIAASIESMDFEEFFSDLKQRMTIDQSIFLKSFKMLSFFRESLAEIEGVKENERLQKLDLKLREFGV